jgi:alpha-beta hydrolase superfamily lysophospholipase
VRELPYERAFREWALARGVRWERLRYPRPEAGGETVAYRFTPAGAPRARLLVVHGAGNDALFSLVGLFKDVLERGLEVFSFDLDGHGRGSTTHFVPGAAAGAVRAALEQANEGRLPLPTHALGISLGGAVLLHALPDLSGDLASAILISAPLRVQFSRRAVLGELRPALLATLWRERAHYRPWELIPSFGPFKRGVYPLRITSEHIKTKPRKGFGYVEVLNAALEKWCLQDAARRVQTPTLLLYGTADRLIPLAQGARLEHLIPGAELRGVEGGTHLTTPLEPGVTDAVLSWLEDCSAQERTRDH